MATYCNILLSLSAITGLNIHVWEVFAYHTNCAMCEPKEDPIFETIDNNNTVSQASLVPCQKEAATVILGLHVCITTLQPLLMFA